MPSVSVAKPPTPLPQLVAGPSMRQAEFHARYEAMPLDTWAELVGGVVYMGGRVSIVHGTCSSNVNLWLNLYRSRTPGVDGGAKVTTILDDLAEPQPDSMLRILPSHGGQTRDVGIYTHGGPELVVEVADDSLAVDLGPKLADYQRAGVREYIVVDLDTPEIIWHARRGDRLVRIPASPDGLYRSEVFPGLWLDAHALLADQGLVLLAALERGLATEEHAAFVAKLARAAEHMANLETGS
jgi:Uma2 family endonuclease